jgi:Flp pilus assembly protein TadG
MEKYQGQALVETALLLPILLILIFGIVDFGRAMYTKNSLNNAARSGARTAVVTPSLSAESGTLESPTSATAHTIKSNLYNKIPNTVTYSLDVRNATGTAPITGNASSGNLVQVTVTWTDFPMITPFYRLAGFFSGSAPQDSGSLTLTGTAAMRYE